MDKIIDNIFEDDNLQYICQADGEDIDKYKAKVKRKLRKILLSKKEILDEVVKVERKYDLVFSDYIICKKCGTIAYGDGDCHCKKKDWTVWTFDLNEKIKEIKNE